MKTVIDAVNEFKGDFIFSINYLLYDRLSGKYCAVDYLIAPSGNGYQQFVCTREEFIATVAECETNFGKCEQSYSDYTIAFVSMDNLNKSFSDKELDMDIWKNAPETDGECCYVKSLLDGIPCGFYEDMKPKMFFRADIEGNKRDHGYLFRSDDYSDKITITRQPETLPPFTQAMADNGVLPSVGMEFICGDEMANDERTVEFKGVKVKVIGVSAMSKDKVITFCHESLGVGCGIFFSSWVKPITPPITLIDGECYQFNSPSGGLFKGYYIPVKGLFVAHKGSFDAHLCTNIQPLTVEVK